MPFGQIQTRSARCPKRELEMQCEDQQVILKPEDYNWTADKSIAFFAALARDYAANSEVREDAMQHILLIVGAIDRYTDHKGVKWTSLRRWESLQAAMRDETTEQRNWRESGHVLRRLVLPPGSA